MVDLFRSQYRELTSDEKVALSVIRDKALGMVEYFDGSVADVCDVDPRCAALFRTKMEEAVMWATKAITG